jgi:hypothetical protein
MSEADVKLLENQRLLIELPDGEVFAFEIVEAVVTPNHNGIQNVRLILQRSVDHPTKLIIKEGL